MRSTRLLTTRITRLLSSTGFTIVALSVLVTGCMCAIMVGTMRLLAILDPQPVWIAAVIQQSVGILTAMGGAGVAALTGTRLSAAARRKSREKRHIQHRAWFSPTDATVDQMLDPRR
jgi:hypothetical protein